MQIAIILAIVSFLIVLLGGLRLLVWVADLVFIVWLLYFFAKVAQHAGAWPF